MKTAQMTSKLIIYVLVVLFGVFILYFGYIQISRLSESATEGEMLSFRTDIQNALRSNIASADKPFGTVTEQSFKVPSNVEAVCFFDETKEFNLELDPDINNFILENEGYNFFMKPGFKPRKLENMGIGTVENPLCIQPRNGWIRLMLASEKGKTVIEPVEVEDVQPGCVHISGEKEPASHLDIVFLGLGYEDREEFVKDADFYKDSFANFEPFASNLDKFAFYRVDSFRDMECEIGDWVTCNNVKVSELASSCPHDYIIILVSRSKVKNFFRPVRSSAVKNIAKINTAQNVNVFMHEWGHLFGGLADEYVDQSYYTNIGLDPAKYPNCDKESNEPGKFSSVADGWYKGCSLRDYYRGVENSIMKSLNFPYYGPVNEDVMMRKLAVYSR